MAITLTAIIEAALFAAGEPLSLEQLSRLFPTETCPPAEEMQTALTQLEKDYRGRGVELTQLASGYCFQTQASLSPWVQRLWPDKQPRHSRAFLETLAIIAWCQPVSRGDIEAIRGVAVNTSLFKTLLDYEWIQVVGEREAPGRPKLYGTTQAFLDHFNIESLATLPELSAERTEST